MSRRLPALTSRQVIRVLERAGFVVRRVKGSHFQLVHAEDPARRVSVPHHNRDLKRGMLLHVIGRAGFTVEEFLDLL